MVIEALSTRLCHGCWFSSNGQSLNIQSRILFGHCFCQTEILLQLVLQNILQLGRRRVTFLCRFALLYRDKVDDERILHRKDGIVFEVVGLSIEYLRDKCLVAWGFDPELNERSLL